MIQRKEACSLVCWLREKKFSVTEIILQGMITDLGSLQIVSPCAHSITRRYDPFRPGKLFCIKMFFKVKIKKQEKK